MPIAEFFLVETYGIYRYADTKHPDDLGEMPAPIKANLEYQGDVKGRVNMGDSLEPDVLGSMKNYDTDVSSMWIGFFKLPVGFKILTGDIVICKTDNARRFQIQFIDDKTGGCLQSHIECRLQTTDVWRHP